MSTMLAIVAAVVAGFALIFGLARLSMWVTARKEASRPKDWADNAAAGGDGSPMWSDGGGYDGGGD